MSRDRDPSETGRAIIFDLDGTLIDTHDAHHAAWRTACAVNGIELTPAMFAWSFGRTNPAIIRRFWADDGRPEPDDETIERVAEAKEKDFRTELDRSFPAMPGVLELVTGLRERGFAIAIGTSAPRENLELAVDRLGIAELVDASVCGGEVIHGKPDPAVFLMAADRLGAIEVDQPGHGPHAARISPRSAPFVVPSPSRSTSLVPHAASSRPMSAPLTIPSPSRSAGQGSTGGV